ncbi:MAG: hypothetical protein NC453_16000 [Muribaculum sp.]|nr:hypothetical protein [Muribaculum sp.]
MAEDQGVNGDMWNDCAVRLCELFGWSHIGDKNMDLPGIDNKDHGIDALMEYDSPNIDVRQSCFIESKRYSTDSVSYAKLRGWIETLRKKLELFAASQELLEEFPALEDCCQVNLGIIMCWIHDAPSESYFVDTFNSYLDKAIFNTAPNRQSQKRICVFSNPQIIKLCGVADEITKKDANYKFVYPSQLIEGRPLERTKVLTIEYALSDIILAERFHEGKNENVVFFMGQLSIQALNCLHQALTLYNFLEKDKTLVIFYHGSTIEKRKIIAEAQRIFDGINLQMKSLPKFDLSSEPYIINPAND